MQQDSFPNLTPLETEYFLQVLVGLQLRFEQQKDYRNLFTSVGVITYQTHRKRIQSNQEPPIFFKLVENAVAQSLVRDKLHY